MNQELQESSRIEPSETISKLSAEHVIRLLKDINRIGNRWLGTKGEVNARHYILDKFRELGLEDVRTEEFTYLHYAPKVSQLRITIPFEHVLDCQPLEYCANGEAEAELVFVGQGTEEDFRELERAGMDVRGKIVVTTSFQPFLLSNYCELHGAVGMVVISNCPDNYIRNLTSRYEPDDVNPSPPFEKYLTKFPGVIISAGGGEKLLSLMSIRQGVRAKVVHHADYSVKATSNIIGTVRGAEPDRKVIAIAHYDSQLQGELVVDNWAGIVALLEIARVVAKRQHKRSVVFIASSAAEIGLLGAADYAQRHNEDVVKNVVAVITLDALSSKFYSQNEIWATNNISELACQKAADSDWKVDAVVDLAKWAVGDYYPFMKRGVPSTWIWEFQPKYHPFYHTEKDIVDYIDPRRLLKVMEVNSQLIFHISDADELQFRHLK